MKNGIKEQEKAINAEIAKAESETELENLLKDLKMRKEMAERDRISIWNQLMEHEFLAYIQVLDAEIEKQETALREKRAARKERDQI